MPESPPPDPNRIPDPDSIGDGEESRAPAQALVVRLFDRQLRLSPNKTYTIGRSDGCDLTLGHGSVSEAHIRLEVSDDSPPNGSPVNTVVAHDLRSLTGTKIDGQSILSAPWAPGQILEVGEIRLELEVLAVAAGSTVNEPGKLNAESIPAIAGHKRHQADFGDVMFTELKRAPWFLLSALLHAVALLLLWFFLEEPIPVGFDTQTYGLVDTETIEEIEDDSEAVELESAEEMEEPEFMEREPEEQAEELLIDQAAESNESDPDLADFGSLMTKGASGTGLSDILKEGSAAISGKFRRTVAGLRKNGLELVFVFDSTGSMGAVLQAAKDRVAKMVDVLQELVPYARIGVITYRDHGRDETYLLRKVMLSRDFYRAMNFMQTVYAQGGGDEPEAVYDGLREAIRQKWSPTARRMVILIGDAPPHKKTNGRIASMVKDFARNKRSFVHSMITGNDPQSDLGRLTEMSFKRIAKDGRGDALAFSDEQTLLRSVMSLAFGRKETRSLDEVYRLAERRSARVTTRSKELARGSDLGKLRAEFRRPVISHDLVKAILINPRPPVLRALTGYLTKSTFPNPGRHAAAYILQKALKTQEPAVDPENGKHISRRRAKFLLRKIDKLRR